ncbi:MAG: hypothetical protein LBG96_03185 [Tannerella sp.]|jgi:hypothetical protein|nr:hypothetical protein [Tannerella sp.]
MKKIVEEWKTVEGYPIYEISNMGRCRNKKRGLLKERECRYRFSRGKKKNKVIVYRLSKNSETTAYSVGMLVARHFVPNPNGYKLIRYKDGDVNNACHWNIEWILTPRANNQITKKMMFSREEQIETYRINRDRIDRIIKYLECDRIGDLVNDEILPIIKEEAKKKFPCDEIEEFVSYATDYFADCLSRGHTIINIERYSKYVASSFYYLDKKNNAVPFDEAFMQETM